VEEVLVHIELAQPQ
jgi:ABC-type uncharacterized transport system ATPase component